MTLDDKIELATIMADFAAANAEQAKAILDIVMAAKDHVSDELCDRVLDAGKSIQRHYEELEKLAKLSISEALSWMYEAAY